MICWSCLSAACCFVSQHSCFLAVTVEIYVWNHVKLWRNTSLGQTCFSYVLLSGGFALSASLDMTNPFSLLPPPHFLFLFSSESNPHSSSGSLLLILYFSQLLPYTFLFFSPFFCLSTSVCRIVSLVPLHWQRGAMGLFSSTGAEKTCLILRKTGVNLNNDPPTEGLHIHSVKVPGKSTDINSP